VIDLKPPIIENLIQLSPTPLEIPEQLDGHKIDSCLFYTYGNEVESSLPCKPPMGKYELRLHLAHTEVFLAAGISQIVQPQITHIVLSRENHATVFFDQEWPAVPELCL